MSELVTTSKTPKFSDGGEVKNVVRPVPRVRRAMSPPRVPPPPPPSQIVPPHSKQNGGEIGDRSPEEENVHQDRYKESEGQAKEDEKRLEHTDQVDVDDIHLIEREEDEQEDKDTIPHVVKTTEVDPSAIDDEESEADIIPVSDSDEDEQHDYMNWTSDVVLRARKNGSDGTDGRKEESNTEKRRSRPLSNYCNVAPLPEPTTEQEDSTTKTMGQATSNSSTEGPLGEETTTYRFKPKYRAPARPPPGYKKLPPVDNKLINRLGMPGNRETNEENKPEPKSISRHRPVLKKTSSSPLSDQIPKPSVPVKPPRNRQGQNKSSSSPSPSPTMTPPPLSHPVVIPPRPKNEFISNSEKSSPTLNAPPFSHPVIIPPKHGKTSPILTTYSSSRPPNLKSEQLSHFAKSSPSLLKSEEHLSLLSNEEKKHKSSSEILSEKVSVTEQKPSPSQTPRKPTPNLPGKTPPNIRKDISGISALPEASQMSPGGMRKAARVAPPPPKSSRSPLVKHDDKAMGDPPVDRQDQSSPPVPPKATLTPSGTEKEEQGVRNEKKLALKKNSADLETHPDRNEMAVSNGKTAEVLMEKETTDHVEIESSSSREEISGGGSSVGEDIAESVLSRMNLFTVEMRKVEGQGFGLHIAEGYAHTSKGLEVKGVFVKEIVAGSPADHCGRIRESDMIVDIAGVCMLGASLEDAARILKSSGNIVRLKIGRTFSGSIDDRIIGLAAEAKPNPLQEENERLKTELAEAKDELEESQQTVADLTQAVANVTVEKTKLDMQIKSLKDKLEKAKSASSDLPQNNQEMEDLKKEKAVLEEKTQEMSNQNQSLETRLKAAQADLEEERREVKSLREELGKVKEDMKTEKEKAAKRLADSEEETNRLKKELEKEKKEKELVTKSMSEKIINLEKEVANSKEMVVVEVAKQVQGQDIEETNREKEEPQETKKPNTEKLAVSKEVTPTKDEGSVEVTPIEEMLSREGTPFTDEELDEDLSLDDVKPVNRLNSSTALQKSQLTSHMRRKKPTRSHVQSLATLSPFPEEMPRLKVNESDEFSRRSISDTNIHVPTVAPKPRSRTEDKTTPIAPKPRPRPQPRKRQSPEHTMSPTEKAPKTPPESPVAAKRPIPVPRTPSRENENEAVIKNALENPTSPEKGLEKKEAGSPSPSPKHSPLLPPKPKPTKDSPEHSPLVKPKPKPPVELPPQKPPETTNNLEAAAAATSTDLPTPSKRPKPVPPKPDKRSSDTGDGMDEKIDALKRKDPSELTVKEKMMLAQQAMVKQAEFKSKGLPPPIRKRPQVPSKAMSVDMDDDQPSKEKDEDQIDGGGMDRSHSLEDLVDENTPRRQPKKLPPGAFNIGIPMGTPGDMRTRSYTVSSGVSGSDLGSSTEEHSEAEKPNGSTKNEAEEVATENHTPLKKDVSDDTKEDLQSSQSTPHSTPSHKRSENGEPSEATHNEDTINSPDDNLSDDVQSDDNDLESSQDLLQTTSTLTATSLQPDMEQVLYWSPDVVGIWLSNIGLAQYAQVFKDKEVKGYMLFDFDNAKLKGMGINSSDDRKHLTKEVKSLKPYAERLKKEYEKQKKEEKRRMEQEKKLAKKKKK